MQIGSRLTIGVHIITAIDYFKDMDRVNSEFLAGSIGVNPVIVRSSFHSYGKPVLCRHSAAAAARSFQSGLTKSRFMISTKPLAA